MSLSILAILGKRIKSIRKYCVLLFILLIPGSRISAVAPVVIDYFFEPGCPECRQVSETILPALNDYFPGAYILNYRDLNIMTNYLVLVRCQETAGSMKNEAVYMAVNERRLFSGLPEIQAGFLPAVDEIIHERSGASTGKSSTVATDLAAGISGQQTESSPRRSLRRNLGHPPDSEGLLDSRFRQFTIFGVLLAGLVDGLNPCAISTLVFFVSILSLAGFRNRRIVPAGIWFCGASFITYTAIGFGLFRFLHGFAGFPYIRQGLESGMGGILVVMAMLSFYDAWQYRRSGNPESLTLRLPIRIKRIMNAIMRNLPKARHVSLAAFLIGAAVTVLETVCTGQVYVPTLVLIIKSGASPVLGLIYLLLYNLMFILPLVMVFGLTVYGMNVQSLIAWSKRQVVISKTAMACLFIALALILILL